MRNAFVWGPAGPGSFIFNILFFGHLSPLAFIIGSKKKPDDTFNILLYYGIHYIVFLFSALLPVTILLLTRRFPLLSVSNSIFLRSSLMSSTKLHRLLVSPRPWKDLRCLFGLRVSCAVEDRWSWRWTGRGHLSPSTRSPRASPWGLPT